MPDDFFIGTGEPDSFHCVCCLRGRYPACRWEGTDERQTGQLDFQPAIIGCFHWKRKGSLLPIRQTSAGCEHLIMKKRDWNPVFLSPDWCSLGLPRFQFTLNQVHSRCAYKSIPEKKVMCEYYETYRAKRSLLVSKREKI